MHFEENKWNLNKSRHKRTTKIHLKIKTPSLSKSISWVHKGCILGFEGLLWEFWLYNPFFEHKMPLKRISECIWEEFANGSWIFGATKHMNLHRPTFNIYEVIWPRNVQLDDEIVAKAIGMGSIIVGIETRGKTTRTHFTDVFHVPKLQANMLLVRISVSCKPICCCWRIWRGRATPHQGAKTTWKMMEEPQFFLNMMRNDPIWQCWKVIWDGIKQLVIMWKSYGQHLKHLKILNPKSKNQR